MKKRQVKKVSMDILYEMAGSFLIGLAIYNFALPAQFPMAGFSGVAMIIYQFTSAPIGLVTMALNVPVAILCFKLIGWRFLLRSFRCMAISSFFMDYISPLLPQYEGERLLAAILTGVRGGAGYAVIYTRNSSTGGSDFIVMAAKAVRPHVQLGTITFVTDTLIVLGGGLMYRDFDGVVYGMIVAYLLSVVVDKMFYGLNAGKVAWIVTAHPEDVYKAVDRVSARGATIFQAQGAYQLEEKKVVMVACSMKEMFQIVKAVKKVDPAAFTVVQEAAEVHGEGFSFTSVAE